MPKCLHKYFSALTAIILPTVDFFILPIMIKYHHTNKTCTTELLSIVYDNDNFENGFEVEGIFLKIQKLFDTCHLSYGKM